MGHVFLGIFIQIICLFYFSNLAMIRKYTRKTKEIPPEPLAAAIKDVRENKISI